MAGAELLAVTQVDDHTVLLVDQIGGQLRTDGLAPTPGLNGEENSPQQKEGGDQKVMVAGKLDQTIHGCVPAEVKSAPSIHIGGRLR